jgi:GT2 family glycosyltransferase
MHVAVCIVGFRNLDDIAACLAALTVQSHSDFEVLICENGGDEAYSSLCQQLPPQLTRGQPIRLHSAPDNPGYAGGVNLCIGHSKGADAWWVLNPDTRPCSEALEAMICRLQNGDCEAVGSVLHAPNGQVQSYGGIWRSWLARAEVIGRNAVAVTDPDVTAIEQKLSFISGASMLVSRRFVQAVGPMREDYFLYCEEVEWCLRALKQGLRLGLAPGAHVEHNQGSTTGSAAGVCERGRLPIFLDERNKMLVTQDCFPSLLVPAAFGAFAMLAMRYARRGAWRQFRYGLAGWMAGLRGQRGKPAWLSSR